MSEKVLLAGRDTQTHNYEAALSACGVPFRTSLSPTGLSSFGRLLLPGGGDVDPVRFGQTDAGSRNIDAGLDDAQFLLLDAFVRTGKPVLAICRGMQLINIYFGGDLVQDLPAADTHRYLDGDQFHPVRNAPGSILHRLYGERCTVNSAHHQGCGRIGHGLNVTQISPDGVAEGLEHMEKPVLGVQWHPERTGFSFHRREIADGETIIRYFLTLL